jgi:NAD-dependent dihydropyrimidine dehydrogenase PreA subunit
MSSAGYKVSVDHNKCIGCAQCYAACPNKVFVIENKKAVPRYQEKCVGCRACVTRCPSGAITLTPRDVYSFFAKFYSKQ